MLRVKGVQRRGPERELRALGSAELQPAEQHLEPLALGIVSHVCMVSTARWGDLVLATSSTTRSSSSAGGVAGSTAMRLRVWSCRSRKTMPVDMESPAAFGPQQWAPKVKGRAITAPEARIPLVARDALVSAWSSVGGAGAGAHGQPPTALFALRSAAHAMCWVWSVEVRSSPGGGGGAGAGEQREAKLRLLASKEGGLRGPYEPASVSDGWPP